MHRARPSAARTRRWRRVRWPAWAHTAQDAILPDSLVEQIRRLAMVSALEWARLELEDVATWLCRGRWWRKAGERNPHTAHAEPEIDDDGVFLVCTQDDDKEEEGHPDVPLALQPSQNLARAFREWAASPHTGMHLSWLLRPATTGPQPTWMDHAPGFPLLATAADVTQPLALSLEDLLWLAPEHAHWRECRNGGHALPPSHYRYRLLAKPRAACAFWKHHAHGWPRPKGEFWIRCWRPCLCTKPHTVLFAAAESVAMRWFMPTKPS